MSVQFNTHLVDDATSQPIAGGRVVLLQPGPEIEPVRQSDGSGFSNFYSADQGPSAPVRTEIIADAAGYAPWSTYGDPVDFQHSTVDVVIRLQRSF